MTGTASLLSTLSMTSITFGSGTLFASGGGTIYRIDPITGAGVLFSLLTVDDLTFGDGAIFTADGLSNISSIDPIT